MSLESVYRLSLIMNLIDNISGPTAKVSSSVGNSVSKLESMSQALGNMAKTGTVMAGIGAQITDSALAPVEATFETRRAIGELASLGVKDLGLVEDAARSFSDQWAGTTKAEFISAAYDIKSGIASLSDEGVAQMTDLSGLTAKATKSTIGEMTSLFATGYGIYKNYYSNMSDLQFGEMFSAGIATAVKQFKTTGAGMAQSIQTLGASATTANVPFEEQLSILGMLQGTMGGSEAGTKYKAFLRSAAQGGKELGLSFIDANNQLLSMPEILDRLRGKFGDTMDAAEKMQLQQAFGDTEAVGLIDLMYGKVGDLQSNILGMYDALGSGTGVTQEMASAINNTERDRYAQLQQRLQNVKEAIGNSLLPTVNEFLAKSDQVLTKVGAWIDNNQGLVRVIMLVVLAIGGFITVAGTTMAVVGGVGLIFSKTAGMVSGFLGIIRKLPGMLDTIRLYGMFAGDGIRKGFSMMRVAGASAISSIKSVVISIATMAKTAVISGVAALKNMAIGLIGMAKQAIVTAATAMPGLIASTWAFTAALLANPITWIVIAIVALIVAIILLWKNWDTVVAWIKKVWDGFVNGIVAGFEWIQNLFAGMPGWLKILLAVFMPFIAIPMLIIQNWDSIVAFFTNMWTRIKEGFVNGINSIKEWFAGIPAWFKESGAKIIETIVEGIKSVAMKPVEAITGIFQKVRNLLPFSDAKEGPLSTLTLSGQRTMTTYAEGVSIAQDAPSEAIEQGLNKTKAALDREPVKKVKIGGGSDQQDVNETESSSSGSGKNVIIQKLLMPVDLKKLKDLQSLLKLLAEVEDYTNGSSDDSDDDLPAVPAPT